MFMINSFLFSSFQDITYSENVQWNENILSKNAEYGFLPLPSTSQPPQGLTFEKTLVSQNESVENVKVPVRNYERIVGKPNRNRDSTLTEREKILLSHLTQTKLSLKRLAVEMRTVRKTLINCL
ncbi:uncharacterized protein LOC123655713 [Melitaea cinxia]|uniref:uncharacterized protein LOC123655713 n=1 Tax=Melitaea cinxia TaxID=113334 RepID=UPI001E2712D7|nr:uncharacterized protein LOC123655713 [Melitaea cinxia]